MVFDFLFIGSGLASLTAARQLQQAGNAILLVDKSRGLGGRLACRYLNGQRTFEMSVPYFTGQEEAYLAWLEQLTQQHLLVATEHGYQTTQGLSSIGRSLGTGLPHVLQQRVTRLDYQGHWQVTTATEQTMHARGIVFGMPMPQVIPLLTPLLNDTTIDDQVLSELKYDPCLTLLIVLRQPSTAAIDERLCQPPFASVIDHRARQLTDLPALTVHLDLNFSQAHCQLSEFALQTAISKLLQEYDLADKIETLYWHRWQYAHVVNPRQEAFCQLAGLPHCYLIGDGFAGGEAQGAYLSGLALGQRLVS